MHLKLYDKSNIDALPFIDNVDAQYAVSYLVPMVQDGVEKYFDNVQGEMKILTIDHTWLMPVFVPEISPTNAYVASLYTHYISYCFDELKELKNPFLENIAKIILFVLGLMLKTAQIDKTVFVNNWLLSTNLYTDFPIAYIKAITEFVSHAHQGYAVVWSSINDVTVKKFYHEMKQHKYLFLPSRSIYILDQFEGFPARTSYKIRKDIKLLDQSDFHIEKVQYEKEIVKLYNNLYIDKYSHYNTKFNDEFTRLSGNNGLIHYYALKDSEGKSIGVFGFHVRQNIMTAPILGYDFTFDKSVGLYRQLSIKLFLEARENGYILNSSSGVGRFKMERGAKRCWEYRVMYIEGINLYRRCIYKALQLVISKIGVPMMDKMKL